jgi:hypothetical protein
MTTDKLGIESWAYIFVHVGRDIAHYDENRGV